MVGRKMQARGFVLCVLLLSTLGCGRKDLPELGYVTGTVTMDGKPLEGAMVRVHPEAGGREGVGITDSEGKYELTYVGGVEGAKIGPSTVAIGTNWPDGEPREGEFETIPKKYNSATTLKVIVEPGDNVFDFPLKSK